MNRKRTRILFLILFFVGSLAGVVLYFNHLFTDTTFSRIFYEPFNLFTIFWSGAILVASFGIGFGVAYTQPVLGLENRQLRAYFTPLTVLFLGWIGARLFDILFLSPVSTSQGITSPNDYFSNPILLVDLNWGGLNSWGAVTVIGLWIIWRNWRNGGKLSAIYFKAMVGFLIGLSLFQWGYFINQELYGYPWSGFGSIFVEPIYRLPRFADEARFFPTMILAALWYGAGAVWLLFGRRWRISLRSQTDGVLVGLTWFVVGKMAFELAAPNSLFNVLPALGMLIIILGVGITMQIKSNMAG